MLHPHIGISPGVIVSVFIEFTAFSPTWEVKCPGYEVKFQKLLCVCVSRHFVHLNAGKGKTRKSGNGKAETEKRKKGGKAEKRVKGGKAEKRVKGGKAEKRVKGGKAEKRKKG